MPFTEMEMFLREVRINSEHTERAYRAGLRAFADWLQINGRYHHGDLFSILRLLIRTLPTPISYSHPINQGVLLTRTKSH
jgi:hypothetical protein